MSPASLPPFGVASAELVGRTLAGRYHIDELLAEGGMGSIFVGRDEQTGEAVAIKVMRSELAHSEEALARFQREVRAVVSLDSPHIVKAHDTGTVEGMPYLVMERLRGRGLDELQAEEEITARRAVAIVLDLVEGLADAHAAGVIHRDLKPSNVWITEDERVKILDFGVAKMHGAAKAPGDETGKLTGSGAVLGSPAYMSPEQLVSSKEADERADVWSVGVVLFELLTGSMLFKAETVGGVFANVIRMRIPALREVLPGASPELERVLAQCLDRDATRRFSSAGVLAEKLRALLEADARGDLLVAKGSRRSLSSWPERTSRPDSTLGESPTVALDAAPETGRDTQPPSRRWVLALGLVAIAAATVVAVAALWGASAARSADTTTEPRGEAAHAVKDTAVPSASPTSKKSPDRAGAAGSPAAAATSEVSTGVSADRVGAAATTSLPATPTPSPAPAAAKQPPEDDLWETSRH